MMMMANEADALVRSLSLCYYCNGLNSLSNEGKVLIRLPIRRVISAPRFGELTQQALT